MMTKPMDTSYETICAAERSDDRNAISGVRRPARHDHAVDHQGGDHGDAENPDIEDRQLPISAFTGITAQAESASTAVTSGAIMNTPLLAPRV